MLKLFYSPGACSLASHIALIETGAPFELSKVPVADKSNRQPDYLAVNPRGFIPALAVDDWIMTENAAIMLYLAQRYPAANLLPAEPAPLAKALEWLAWQSSTAHPAFAHLWRPERFVDTPEGQEIVKKAAIARARAVGEEIEAWLKRNDYAAGLGFSAADGMFLVLYRWLWRAGEPVDERSFPAWTRYAERLGERPSVRQALETEQISLFP
ncbi:MAG: glutathione S-transferase family protein [Reyranellaceae bacterium]